VNTSGVADLLDRRGVPLVEDACQGFGARCHGVAAGTEGAAGVFSFQQSKQLSAGEGGLVIANDPAIAARCTRFTDLGASRDKDGAPSWDDAGAVLAQNLRITELQSVLLQSQLEGLNQTLIAQGRARKAVVANLDRDSFGCIVHSADPDGDAASHLLLRVGGRSQGQALIAYARANGVLVRPVWDRVYYEHSVFARAGLTPSQLGLRPAPRAEALAQTLLSVPTPASLDESGAEIVARTVSAGLHLTGAER
jgi:perosamine synthetase